MTTSEPGSPQDGRPLGGLRIVEAGGGVAGGWCGRLFADLGADVTRLALADDPLARRRADPDAPETAGLLRAWLDAGKTVADAAPTADVLILGEDLAGPAPNTAPVTVDVSWFGRSGPRAGWKGCDLIVQALSGMTQLCGPREGPPQHAGFGQSAIVGGVTAFIAAMAGVIAGGARRFEVSILEAAMVLGELQTADSATLVRKAEREGVNRFHPTCPLGIYRCAEGWLGITVITPAQWRGLCDLLEMQDLADDPDYATIALRSDRVDVLEERMKARLVLRTAAEWAADGRRLKLPMAVVADAAGLIAHPAFSARRSLMPIRFDGHDLPGPRSPVRVGSPQAQDHHPVAPLGRPMAPLHGLRIADFSMGWAGPLATRLLADLGAEVIKIEAGRYPDWWRGVDFSPEAVARKQFEESRRFSALNRNKKSVSLDLTTPRGLEVARRLVRASDVVIENQAAGVMERLGLGLEVLSDGRPDLVMVSMSAFGGGNELSETRAYGSTLEHGSGIPSFCGVEGGPPTMAHIAYGDPIGGIYGAAAMVAALHHRRRTGAGQHVNLSQSECLLPFAASPILAYALTGRSPQRLRNRDPERAPHGIYPVAGKDRWIAISVDSPDAWSELARAMGREDWAEGCWSDVKLRLDRHDEIDAAVAEWTARQDGHELSEKLQASGVAAAMLLRPEETMEDPQHLARGFFMDDERPHVGRQRQAGMGVMEEGGRYPLRNSAPFLGGDSHEVLVAEVSLDGADFDELVSLGVVSFQPTMLRG